MEVPKELIDQLSSEILKELEENAKKSGRKLTFDDMEQSILLFRQKVGERMMQEVVDLQRPEEDKKKTVQNAEENV